MAFSGGTFSRTFDCTTDRDNGVKILASKFDTELDGFATGLSTCILKDGTQTCTAAIPFAEGLTVPDNKTIILGTSSDITIQYDESTNDSLEIAANVEGAALGIVLKADQGDDNADQHKLNIADGGVLTLGSKISGSFVNYLTHTPNSTVASSTTAVAGNLTVGGDLTLGSGAVISEAELEAIDGVTAGTVAASKAVIVDSNKDIASFRNVTLTGELDAGSLDISGDADIDGTLEADAMTLNGTAITATATLDTGILNNNVPKFTSGVADDDFLRVAGTAIEGRSASEVLSDIGGQASLTFGISNTNAVKIDSSSVADDEYARFTANGLESRATSEVLSDIGAAPAAGSSNIVTTGALDSGSITSGFGTIDTGSSAITTTGTITGGVVDADNLRLDGNTISSTDTNGDIDVAPNGNGSLHVTTSGSGDALIIESTDAGDSFAPDIAIYRNSSSPADGDGTGLINFRGRNDNSQDVNYVQIQTTAPDVSDGSENGFFSINTMVDGTLSDRFNIGSNGNVGISTASPVANLEVEDGGTSNSILTKITADDQNPFALMIGNDTYSTTDSNAFGFVQRNDGAAYIYNAGSLRLVIDADGDLGIGGAPDSVRFKVGNTENKSTQFIDTSNASFSSQIFHIQTTRGQSDVFNHIIAATNSGNDVEFKVRGDGQVSADGSFSGGGADYAEYFEWTDGNSSSEDRRGYSVVLDGNKVRKATSDDAAATIIGIVSARPVVVGDTAWNHWTGRWERDDYGDVVKEAYTVTTWDEQGPDSNGVAGEGPKVHHSYHTDRIPDGITATSDAVVTSKELDGTTNLMRPKEASNYDASQAYVPRENRVEWDAVGLMGKLRMRKGQPTGDRWIKLRDISSNIEEWLVR